MQGAAAYQSEPLLAEGTLQVRQAVSHPAPAPPSVPLLPRYASLYFCCAIEGQDNELITLEVIHRYVELLDKYFGSVSVVLCGAQPPQEVLGCGARPRAHTACYPFPYKLQPVLWQDWGGLGPSLRWPQGRRSRPCCAVNPHLPFRSAGERLLRLLRHVDTLKRRAFSGDLGPQL